MADYWWVGPVVIAAAAFSSAVNRQRNSGSGTSGTSTGSPPGPPRGIPGGHTSTASAIRSEAPTTDGSSAAPTAAADADESTLRAWHTTGPAVEAIVLANADRLRRAAREVRRRDDAGRLSPPAWGDALDVVFQDVVVDALPELRTRPSLAALALALTRRLADEIADADDTAGVRAAFDAPDVDQMTALEFEEHCAALLRAAGWDARLTVATGDQGVDVIATRRGVRMVVQCKRHAAPVGNSAVQEVIGGRYMEKADLAVVVSTGGFTLKARELAREANVQLVHHSDLARL